DEAFEAYSEAIKRESTLQAKYLIDRGRCSYLRAVRLSESPHMNKARVDLEAGLAKALPPDQQVEARYLLGMVYRFQPEPDYEKAEDCFTEAAQLAEKDGSFEKLYANVLPALGQLADMSIERAKIDTALKAADRMSQAADRLGQLDRKQ